MFVNFYVNLFIQHATGSGFHLWLSSFNLNLLIAIFFMIFNVVEMLKTCISCMAMQPHLQQCSYIPDMYSVNCSNRRHQMDYVN